MFVSTNNCIQLNLKECVSQCIGHLIERLNNRNEEDVDDLPLRLLTIADECNATDLRVYCIWWLQVNFDTVSSLPWFENIPDEYREQITAGQWPGNC